MDFISHIQKKIIDKEDFLSVKAGLHDKNIVFTNGCFDVLHLGHVLYLAQARQLGDLLVVGLNSDASVKRLKGENRPINPQDARATVLAALEFVDYVILFEQDTPIDLIKTILPDTLVKGADYTVDKIVGADVVKANGGNVTVIPLVDHFSSSSIINKINT